MTDTYERFIGFLDEGGARYRFVDHAPEGRTELVSELRGNALAAAAKCLVIMVKLGKKTTRYVLAVVPGDAKVDIAAVRDMLGGTYASFASADRAEALAGSASGTILPVSFHPDLELVVDPALVAHPEIFFNAARLDRSVALDTDDYLRLASPRLAQIAA
ncbi:YbaK/EbsC family protein [Phytohabitans sp. LJ34]|uniref:YbaK/EbsC family protein n=1 Tax=Phytohabitans sp. LJ34 TaxID=3452217 RepID=UPI003F886B6B